jgi:colicin import membrane protein
MSKFENPNEYYENSDNTKGLIGSLLLHSSIVAIIIASLLMTSEQAAGPIQLELWAEGTEQILKAPTETATMNPAEEDTINEDEMDPEPEPAPEPEPTPEAETEEAAPEPEPDVNPPVAESTPPADQEDPEIALDKKREEERLQREQEEKRQQELARQEEQRKEEERKAAAEKKRLAELEAKKKAEAKAAADAKAAAETKAQANRQAPDVRGAMRGDIASIAGIQGGRNTQNQRGGGGGNSAVIQAIQRCVQPLLRFGGAQRLTAHYEVTIDANLRASNARITRRSGNAAFDNAVVNALKACPKYPAAIKSSKFTGHFNYTR